MENNDERTKAEFREKIEDLILQLQSWKPSEAFCLFGVVGFESDGGDPNVKGKMAFEVLTLFRATHQFGFLESTCSAAHVAAFQAYADFVNSAGLVPGNEQAKALIDKANFDAGVN